MDGFETFSISLSVKKSSTYHLRFWNGIKNLLNFFFSYALYARWKNDTYQLHPQLIRRRGKAQKRIKAIMKRVSKENVKPLGRLIGKLSHCAPGFLFDYVRVLSKQFCCI